MQRREVWGRALAFQSDGFPPGGPSGGRPPEIPPPKLTRCSDPVSPYFRSNGQSAGLLMKSNALNPSSAPRRKHSSKGRFAPNSWRVAPCLMRPVLAVAGAPAVALCARARLTEDATTGNDTRKFRRFIVLPSRE